jgi:hypothetical protein
MIEHTAIVAPPTTLFIALSLLGKDDDQEYQIGDAKSSKKLFEK